MDDLRDTLVDLDPDQEHEIVLEYLSKLEEKINKLQKANGPAGKDGKDGKNGRDGIDGVDGRDGRDGKDGRDGERGAKGERGEKGDPGKDADINDLLPEVKKIRAELLSLGSRHSGGSANRNIWINGNSSVLSRYTDINLIPGSNVTITYANNDTKKTTDITLAASGGGSGNLNPQTPVGTINSSNKVFTCTGIVSVAVVDSVIDTVASIAGATNSTITYSTPPTQNVYAF